jgi:hypothetical protein
VSHDPGVSGIDREPRTPLKWWQVVVVWVYALGLFAAMVAFIWWAGHFDPSPGDRPSPGPMDDSGYCAGGRTGLCD